MTGTRQIAFLIAVRCLAPVYGQESSYESIHGVDVATDTPGKLVVRWRGQAYPIVLADLPMAKNLPEEFKDGIEAEVLGIDEASGRLYFGAGAEPSQNKTWGIFSYELETKKLSSLGEFEGRVLRHLSFRQIHRS
jgi:hypothetical protein